MGYLGAVTGDVITGCDDVVAAKAKDRKAKACLLQCLHDDLLMQVAAKKTRKEVWDSLKVRFIGETWVKEARLQILKSEFDAMRMEDDSIEQYAGRLMGMSVWYGNLCGSLDDAAFVKKLFDTVPERFINVVAGIEQFYDLKKLAFEEAVGRLKAYEECTRWGAGVVAKTDTGQVLLMQSEWEVRQKRTERCKPSEKRGRSGQGPRRDHKRAVVEVAGVALEGIVVVVADREMLCRMALANVTRVTSNALSATSMGTVQIDVQVRKIRKKKLTILV